MDKITARQKTRRQYEDFEKQLIRLDKLQKSLMQRKQRLGWEPLNPPVMKGWKRSFILRADVAETAQAAFFQGILEKINTVQYSPTREFTVKKRRRGKKIRVEREQKLLDPSDWRVRRMQMTKEEWAFFIRKTCWSSNDKRMLVWYEFTEPWLFVLHVEKNMVTRVRVRDEALEAEIDRLDQYIRCRNLRPVISKMKYGRYRWRWRNDAPSHRDEAIIKNMNQSWQNYKSGERT